MKKISVEKMIVKARTELLLATQGTNKASSAFLATLAMRLIMAEDTTGQITQTMATDGTRIFWYRPYVEKLELKHLIGVVAHEVLHCAYLHPFRIGKRNIQKANIACDHVINLQLLDWGFELPGKFYADPQFAGMAFETVYNKLPDPPPDSMSGVAGAFTKPFQGDSGSPETHAMSETDWQLAAETAAIVARRQAGNLPGSLEKILLDNLKPRVDWIAETRDFVMNSIPFYQNWSRPNRRFVGNNIYLPGTDKMFVLGTVVILTDSSGSTWPILDKFGAELRGIYEEAKPEKTYVVYVDTKVQKVDEYERDGEQVLELKPVGCGGTMFQPAFDWVEENNINPDVAIYLTDMENFDTPKEPSYPVLWVAPESSRNYKVPFGRAVYIPED